MTRDVTAEMKALLSRNRGPDPEGSQTRVPPVYGIEASLADECVIRLRLTFIADQHYCCAEAGCHLPLGPAGWAAVRETMKLSEYVKLALLVEVVIEAGARFLRFDGTPGFEPYRASQYRHEIPEW